MFKILGFLLIFSVSMNNIFGQKETYFNDNDENFAEVIVNDDLIFTCRVAGLKNSGPYVILLHGFPETY